MPGFNIMRLAGLLLCAASQAGFSVAVDPGHDPLEPGAISARGKQEVDFNDAAAAALKARLKKIPGIRVSLSRQPGEKLSLDERLRRIRAMKPDLVISIHHDSVQEYFFSTEEAEGKRARTCDRFAGFSLFVAGKGPHRVRSLSLARDLARRWIGAGFSFSTHHAMQVPGEYRIWLDQALGIYDGTFLKLLRELAVPAVLLERWVLVNRDEELRLLDPSILAKQMSLLGEAIEALASAVP